MLIPRINSNNHTLSKMTIETLKLYTFNCRGLCNGSKRRAVLKWLKQFYPGIILLQETHSTQLSEKEWCKDWGGTVYFSHGTSSRKGVAILIPPKLDIIVKDEKRDDDGRILILDTSTDYGPLTISNVYFPTKDKSTDQIVLVNKLKEMLIDFQDKSLIVGGDFNICQNPDLDKIGGINENKSKAAQEMETFKTDFNLIDLWRTMYPDSKRCTHRQISKAGLVQSRLDYFLISTYLLYDVECCKIYPGIKSDHSLVHIAFKLNDIQSRGRGFVKFNSMLLQDKHYVTLIKKAIANFAVFNKNLTNKALFWDCLKCEIRGRTISYSAALAKKRRKTEADLIQK